MTSMAAFQAENLRNMEESLQQARSEVEKLRSELASARQRIEVYTTIASSQLEHFRASNETLREIATERQRQVVKGYDAAHDDDHQNGTIAHAAAAYAMAGAGKKQVGEFLYPWGSLNFTPSDRRASLVVAAALIVAEIERLDRVAQQRAA